MKAAWLLVLLLVPASAALSAGESTTAWSYAPPLTEHVEVLAGDPQAGCYTHADGPGPASGNAEPPDFVDVTFPRTGPQLRFTDRDQEQACAEARFHVEIPSGARELFVEFAVHRDVNAANGFQPYLVQELYLYEAAGDDPGAAQTRLECLATRYLDPELNDPDARQFSILFRLDDPDCEPIRDEVVVAFYFGDELPQSEDNLALIDSPRTQQSATVRIEAIEFVFPGLPLDVSIRHQAGLDPGNDVVGFEEASITLPNPEEHWTISGTFSIPNNHSIHGFYAGLQPSLDDRISNDLIDAQERGGWLYFTLSQELVDATGSREFTVHFIPEGAAKIKVERVPFAALALLAPLVLGIVAQRNVNHLSRTARGRLAPVRFSLQGLLAAGWLVYVIVAFVLLVTINGAGMAAWPLPPGNQIAYAALAVSAFTMIATAIAARRREMGLVMENLTELERIQVELQRSNQELEQFAYVASHDLKEPLRMVAGFTQLLEQHLEDGLDDDGRKYLGFASEGARRLQRMVDDLLAYSRVRHDKTSMRVVELDDVVTIVKGHLAQLLKERKVRLKVGDMPKIVADSGQLVQVLMNLVQNAVKFSPQAEPVVEISAKRQHGELHISVRDEGIGIDPAQQARIFQIFQRLHLREDYEGNGIGLAMVKKIAEQAGGRVIVQSAKGEGSTFTVVLPDFVAPPGSEAAPTSVPAGRRA